jgi:hypothetical protein
MASATQLLKGQRNSVDLEDSYEGPSLHDDIFRLLHILGHHLGNAAFFPMSQVGSVVDGAGNIKNAEMRAPGTRDLYLENLNGKILVLPTCTWV